MPQVIIDEDYKGIHICPLQKSWNGAGTLPELKDNAIYKRKELADFFQLCTDVDGFLKRLSVHLGGLLIGEGQLSDLVPLERSSDRNIISQYDKDDIERLRIVKLDLLSLLTLTVIEDAMDNIRKSRHIELDIEEIPRDDLQIYAMLRDGKTTGIFHLESPAQREIACMLCYRTASKTSSFLCPWHALDL